jgi:N-acetylneuraminate synthase
MEMKQKIKIGNKYIGDGQPCFIIAEAGINHNGDFNKALDLIDIAVEAHADCIKFQLFRAEDMYTVNPGDYITAKGKKEPIYDIVKKTELPYFWIPKLMRYCKKNRINFLCTTCDGKSTDILEKFGVSAYKVASSEITHIPLISHIAKKGKPIIFSTAGSYLSEVEEANNAILQEKNEKIAILHCMGKYPLPLRDCNLNIIKTLKNAFPNSIVGYSDHSIDPIKAPIAAVSLGANLIEKHITFNKKAKGADHSFALEPHELQEMVTSIRKVEEKIEKGITPKVPRYLLGDSRRIPYPTEKYLRKFAYRCIFATKDIKKGDSLNRKNIAILRPGNKKRGLHPRYYEFLIKNNIKVTRNIKKGQGINWLDLLKK